MKENHQIGKKKSNVLILMLLLVSILLSDGLRSLADIGGGETLNDITGKLPVELLELKEYWLWDVPEKTYIDSFREKNPYTDEELKLGHRLRTHFTLRDRNMTAETSKLIKTGNYFDLPLKDIYLNMLGEKKAWEGTDKSGKSKFKLGEMEIIKKDEKPFLRVTFKIPKTVTSYEEGPDYSIEQTSQILDDEGRLNVALDSFWCFAEIQAYGDDAEVPFGQDGLEYSETKDVPDGNQDDIPKEIENSSGPYIPKEDLGMSGQEKIIKKCYSLDNGFAYRIHVNRDQAEKMYDFVGDPILTYPVDTTLNSPVVPREDVYVVDELPEGLEIQEGSFGIYVPFFKPGLESDGSGGFRPIKKTSEQIAFLARVDGNGNKSSDFFRIIKNYEKESWVAFQNRIVDSEKPIAGIWKNKKIIVKFKDIPDSKRKYSVAQKKLEQKINKLSNMASNEKSYMRAAYLGDKPILSYSIHFNAVKKDGFVSAKNRAYYKDKSNGGLAKRKGVKYKGLLSGKIALGIGERGPGDDYGTSTDPEPCELTLKKEWRNEDGYLLSDSDTPDSIRVTLKSRIGTQEYVEGEYEIKKSENWIRTIRYYDYEIKDKEFFVEEKNLPQNFKVKYFSNNLRLIDARYGSIDIINTRIKKTTPSVEKRQIEVTKKWQLSDGKNDVSPALTKVEVELYKNSGSSRVLVESAEIQASKNWRYIFQNLPKYETGQEIIYQVVEKTAPLGYEKPVVNGTMAGGFEIINKKKAQPDIPPSTPPSDPSTPPSDPSTPPSTPPSEPSTPPSTPPSEPSTPPSTPPSEPSIPPREPNIPLIPPVEPYEPFVPDVPILPTPEVPSRVPEIPEVHEEIVPNVPFESLDIELQDEVPRGSTDLTENEKKIPNSSEDISVTEDGPPKGNKKVLAKTGGLYVRLESGLAILMGMICMLWLLRKRRVSK